MKYPGLLILPLSLAGIAFGQQDVGYLSNSNATINGAPATSSHEVLGPSSALVTLDRPARVVLSRGGILTVCQRSAIHLEFGHGARSTLKPVHLSLDLGSLEILTLNTSSDSIVAASGLYVVPEVPNHEQTGVLHLAMRVGAHGRTCIENRSNRNPLTVMDGNGSDAYLLKPGEHATFANGSVRNLSSPDAASCGCPSIAAEDTLNADTTHASGANKANNGDQDGSEFPFPANESKSGPEPEVLDKARIQPSGADKNAPPFVTAELNASLIGPDVLASELPTDLPSPSAPNVTPGPALPSLTPRETQVHDSAKGLFAKISQFFKKLFP